MNRVLDVEMEELMRAGDRSYASQFMEEKTEIKDRDYGNTIPVAKDVDSGDIISIKLDGKTRIGLFGQSGSTKTIMSKRLMGAALIFSDQDWKACHISDIKNDMKSFNGVEGPGEGASKSLQNFTEGLLKGEEPADHPRVLAIPYFMTEHYDNYPSRQDVFSLTLDDLSRAEFEFLADFHSWRKAPRNNLIEIFEDRVDFNNTSLPSLIQIAEQDYDESTLARELKKIKNDGLISRRVDNSLRDVLLGLKDKKVLSLGLKHWRNYLPEKRHYFQFYSGKVVREIKALMEKGEIPEKLIIFADEFHKLAPQGEKSILKEEFQDLYDVSARQNDIVTFVSTQRPSQIPNSQNDDDLDFVSELTDVFLMRGRKPLHRSEWKPILRDMGVYDGRGGDQLRKWEVKMQSLEQHEGIYVNSLKHDGPADCPRVRTLCPPVAHPEEDN